MTLPYLLTLNITARLAYPIIQSGVRRGLSSRLISESLQEGGLGIRRATLLEVMKREQNIIQHGLNLKFLPLDRAPDPDKLPESLTQLRRQYSYKVKVFGKNLGTGEATESFITVSSSHILTRREAEERAWTYGVGAFDSGQLEVERVILFNVIKAGSLGTFS